MDERSGAFAFLLDGKGGGRPMSLSQVQEWTPGDGPLWVHLPPDLPELARVLEEVCHMPAPVREQMLADTARVLVEATSEDEVVVLLFEPDLPRIKTPRRQLRAWTSPRRCVTVADSGQAGIVELRRKVEQGRGPRSAAVLETLGASALARTALELAGLNDLLVDLEAHVEERKNRGEEVADELRRVRRALVDHRRFISLARDALLRLDLTDVGWVKVQARELSRLADRAGRLLRELDALADRARLLHDRPARRQHRRHSRNELGRLLRGAVRPARRPRSGRVAGAAPPRAGVRRPSGT
jgi:zinc transporter